MATAKRLDCTSQTQTPEVLAHSLTTLVQDSSHEAWYTLLLVSWTCLGGEEGDLEDGGLMAHDGGRRASREEGAARGHGGLRATRKLG